jgi:hypothetical protein
VRGLEVCRTGNDSAGISGDFALVRVTIEMAPTRPNRPCEHNVLEAAGRKARLKSPAKRGTMRKLIAMAALLALTGFLAEARPPQDRGDRDDHHDNGKHKGWDKHHGDDEERGDRHDNGKHKGWAKQEVREDDRGWDADRARYRPGHPYPFGHYGYVRHEFIARSIDIRTRRIILFDNSNWVVASYDLPRCRDWDWDRDRVFVYDDDHHPGWYLLFNARLGRYVHVEYFGVH